LKRVGKGFLGRAVFHSGGWETIAKVTVPADAAENFLTLLSTSPLVKGRYKPRMEATDSYPAVGIELDMGKEFVLFYSQSQGREHVPWGIVIQNEFYTIPTNTVARALLPLRAYLKENLLEELALKAWRGERPPFTASMDWHPPCPGLFSSALEFSSLEIGSWSLPGYVDIETPTDCVMTQSSVQRSAEISIRGLGREIRVVLDVWRPTVDRSDRITAIYSFDDEEPTTESWAWNRERGLAFAPHPEEFISRLRKSRKLVTSIAAARGTNRLDEFLFAENEEALDVFARCLQRPSAREKAKRDAILFR
jgi:hypothetical protein